MKKILVPMDFSDCSYAAAEMALLIARRTSAQICFFHLYQDIPVQMRAAHLKGIMSEEKGQNAMLGNVKHALASLVAKAEHFRIKASPILIYSTGNDRIEDYILPYHIDFVVMGSHGVSGIKETFLGSNAQRFIRHSPVPVLVVKDKPATTTFSKIVFASNFEEDLVASFEVVVNLARLLKAEIVLMYVNTPYYFKETHESIANMKRFMHQFPDVKYTSVVYDALDEESGIHRYARENDVDIIALVTHGKKGLFRLLSHGVAESIINHENIPVLIINEHTISPDSVAAISEEFDA